MRMCFAAQYREPPRAAAACANGNDKPHEQQSRQRVRSHFRCRFPKAQCRGAQTRDFRVYRGGQRFLVWRALSRTARFERRSLRHEQDDGGASHIAI
jgi:hypothetical protein